MHQTLSLYQEPAGLIPNMQSKSFQQAYELCITPQSIRRVKKILSSAQSIYLPKLIRTRTIVDVQGIKRLMRDLINFKFLQNLNLDFRWHRVLPDEGIQSISEGLRHFPSLQTVTLIFKGCLRITDEGVQSLSEGLTWLTALKNLNMNFYECLNVSDTGVEYIARSLKYLTQLTSVNFHFGKWGEAKLTDESLKFLSSGLRYTTKLKKFEINFQSCPLMTSEGCSSLAKILPELTLVEHIKISFWNARKIDDKGFASLCESLKCMTYLSSIDLAFTFYSSLPVVGVKYLADCLTSLHLLKSLALDFSGSIGFNNKSLEVLSEGLKHISSLRSIKLCLAGCELISDPGIECLSESLTHISSLQSIELAFYRNCQITFNGIKALADCFVKLSSLRNIKIKMRSLPDFTSHTQMSVLIYSNLKVHSRYESKKSMSTAPSKSSLLLSPNTDSYQFSYGLQGSGKFTDNAFKDSLRSGLPSPHVLQRASRSKEPRSSSAANECLSARSLKVSLLERNLKSSSRTETGATSVQQREPRSKENKSLKPTSSLSMLLKKKPKFEGQQTRVLKDSNRELSLYRRGNTPQSSALCTEQDSFVSPQVKSPMVDINQQLRNIFQVGSTQQTNNKIEDYGYPVAEEKKDLDAYKTRVLNTTYVKKPNFVQSMKKF